VGDDDQSIYGWRGAEVENIHKFQKDFPGTKVFKLERNYRSTKKILNIANAIIKNNTKRMEKTLWTENEDGVKIEKRVEYDETHESRFVAETIKSLVWYSGYKYSEIAVLIRLNALSLQFEKEFANYGIPYNVFGGFKFYERKEIKDVVSYLRLLNNPFDEESFLRIINYPKRGIGDSAIAKIREYADSKRITLFDTVLSIEESGLQTALVSKIAGFKEMILKLYDDLESLNKEEFIKSLFRRTGIDAEFASGSEEDINRKINIDQFADTFIGYFDDNADAGLDNFLTNVSLVSDTDKEFGNKVSIATVHSVKGLEFKTVFVCGLDDGIFPISRANNNLHETEEERRLMYVAVTRAMERLYLTRARSRYLYGERKYTLESRFLTELSEFFDVPKEKPLFDRFDRDFDGEREYETVGTRIARQAIEIKPQSKDFSSFKKGVKIYHKVFGEGVIIDIKDSVNADIAFPKIGVKTFNLNFAPITLTE